MLICRSRIRTCFNTFITFTLASSLRTHRRFVSIVNGVKTTENYTQPRTRSGPRDRTYRSSIAKELIYLDDPLRLANHTRNLLHGNERKKALELVRLAGKTKPCTVSWNHVIDHDMGQGRINLAIKDYNEVFSTLFGIVILLN